MINYSKYKTATAEPEASSMIETFRAIGYTVESAIADIIDNSISAGARRIWLDYEWSGEETTISIIDDGIGMSNTELINAMRPGCKNPLATREAGDLGRFGLGLKTASFSQCKKFCVISKVDKGDTSCWTWDLDYVNQVKQWSLINYCPTDSIYRKIEQAVKGTAVIWWDLDRLTNGSRVDDTESLDKFMRSMDIVKRHVGMVFHRYISAGITIFFRNRAIEAWDPFMVGSDGLQLKADVYLDNRKLLVKGYVLPHRSKLTADKYSYGKGPKDSWTAHQGFYVYRNKRLLVAGDWLGIGNFKKEVHYDLCRILIDLPNHCDDEWQIDIKKSIARPPLKYREQILSIAKDVRAQAVEVYRFKGKVLRRKHFNTEEQFLWEDYKRHDKRYYRLNRAHPVLKQLLQNDRVDSVALERALRFIEETIPIPLITLKENENEVPHGLPFEGTSHDLIKATMDAMYFNLLQEGVKDENAKAIILGIEPFNSYPQYVVQINNLVNDK